MKVAFINQPWGKIEPPVESGSIPIIIYQTARRLAKFCQVFVYSRGQFYREEKSFQGVTYCSIPVFVDKILVSLIKKVSRFFKFKEIPNNSNFTYPAYTLQIALELRQKKFDIVHIHNFSQFVPLIRLLNPKIKIVLHMHCEWLTQFDAEIIEKRLRDVDLIIGCSDYITKKIQQKFPNHANRCHTVYNGIDPDLFPKKERSHSSPHTSQDYQLLFVGRISPEKGLHLLLDAFQEVRQQIPNVKLTIVGPDEAVPLKFIVGISEDPNVINLASFYQRSYLAQLKEQISPEMANQVVFTGGVPQSKLIEYYQNADVLINPSLSEAFGMSLAEAMAVEVPVIAARVGGMVDVVAEGQTGLFFESADVDGLTKAIIQLLSDEPLRKAMGEAGHERVMKIFAWDRVVENLFNEYKKLCTVYE